MCARAVAGGGIVGRTVQHDAGGAVAAVTADEVFNVGLHQCSSTSPVSYTHLGRIEHDVVGVLQQLRELVCPVGRAEHMVLFFQL